MLDNKIILLLAIVGLVFLISQKGRENMGSAFFHRGKLADINSNIQYQVNKARQFFNKNENVKENFVELEHGYIQNLKESIKDKPLEKFKPSRYVISDYSFKATKAPTDIDLDSIQVGQLESPDFASPINYSGTKALADYLEVSAFDSGSGDITDLKEAYKMVNRQQYVQNLKAIRIRGGNVYMYPTKECNPKGGKDIVGFL